jgi:hypothetical protein
MTTERGQGRLRPLAGVLQRPTRNPTDPNCLDADLTGSGGVGSARVAIFRECWAGLGSGHEM